MKSYLVTLLLNISAISSFSQNQLSAQLNEETKKQLGIHYPIQYTHEYTDRIGTHLLILTAQPRADTTHGNLKAICMQNKAGKWVKEWEANDLIMGEEQSIFYRNGLIRVQDLDKDGLIEPLLVYGTVGENGADDGRLKIIIYYKGVKSAIRHQNGVLDFERNTQIDQSFYSLPSTIQKSVQYTMAQAEKLNFAIFPSNWQKAMSKKAIKINN